MLHSSRADGLAALDDLPRLLASAILEAPRPVRLGDVAAEGGV